MMSTAGQAVALPEAANWNTSRPAARRPVALRPVALRPVALRLDARQASLKQPWKIHDTIAIPTRGILMGTLLSSFLWAALIVGGRALWLYLR
jgi:hypothetical protein